MTTATRHRPGRAPRGARTWTAAVLALILSAGTAGCFKRPTVSLHDVTVEGIDFSKIDLAFDLKIHNPNNFQISLSSLTYGMASGGADFARGAVAQPIALLSANETTAIRAPVTLNYAELLPLVEKARAGQAIPYQFRSEARFNFLGMKIPVRMNRQGQIPPLRRPSWHFRKVRLVKGPPSWLEMTFEVDNPNTFDLPLARIHGALTFAGQPVVRIDESQLAPIPAGKTAPLTVRVRADGPGVAKAVAKTFLGERSGRFAFEGALRLRAPPMLRKMLLGQK